VNQVLIEDVSHVYNNKRKVKKMHLVDNKMQEVGLYKWQSASFSIGRLGEWVFDPWPLTESP